MMRKLIVLCILVIILFSGCAKPEGAFEWGETENYEYWKYRVDSSIREIFLEDFDRDGDYEVIVGTRKSVYCFDLNGSLKWRVSDVRDSNLEFIISKSKSENNNVLLVRAISNIYSVSSLGEILWKYNLEESVDMDTCFEDSIIIASNSGIILLNLNGEKLAQFLPGVKLESAICDNSTGRQRIIAFPFKQVIVLDTNGNILLNKSIEIGIYNPYIADITGDGEPEIIEWGGYILSANFSKMINLGDYKHIVFLDVDDNGVTDVVTYQEGEEIKGKSGYITAFNGEGKVIWNKTANISFSEPVSFDFNGDGYEEILIEGYGNFVYIFDRHGNLIDKYKIPLSNYDEIVIKKINNEIIMVISDIFDVYLLKTKI
jgi:hypothetical protein